MGAGKDLWMAEYEQLGERVIDENLTYDEFASEMKTLGFDPYEIDDHWAALLLDMGDGDLAETSKGVTV